MCNFRKRKIDKAFQINYLLIQWNMVIDKVGPFIKEWLITKNFGICSALLPSHCIFRPQNNQYKKLFLSSSNFDTNYTWTFFQNLTRPTSPSKGLSPREIRPKSLHSWSVQEGLCPTMDQNYQVSRLYYKGRVISKVSFHIFFGVLWTNQREIARRFNFWVSGNTVCVAITSQKHTEHSIENGTAVLCSRALQNACVYSLLTVQNKSTVEIHREVSLRKASWSIKPWMWNLATTPAWSDLIHVT